MEQEEKIHLGIGEYVLCHTFTSVWSREGSNFGIRTTEEVKEVTCKRCLAKLRKRSPLSFLNYVRKEIEINRLRNEKILNHTQEIGRKK